MSGSSGEYTLIRALAEEIMPFRQGKPGAGARTLKLSPYGSDLFGFDVSREGGALLGWPESLWPECLSIRWEGSAQLKGDSHWLYLIMAAGPRNLSVALAVKIRHQRLRLMDGHTQMTVVPMDDRGHFTPNGSDRLVFSHKLLPAPTWAG